MPLTNVEKQRAFRERQRVKRMAVQDALGAMAITVTKDPGGGKANIKWEVQELDRPILEAWAAEKGFDLDVWLREMAVKAMLAALPVGKVSRQDMVNADGTYMEKDDS